MVYLSHLPYLLSAVTALFASCSSNDKKGMEEGGPRRHQKKVFIAPGSRVRFRNARRTKWDGCALRAWHGTNEWHGGAGGGARPRVCLSPGPHATARQAGGRDGCWACKRFATSLAPSSLCCWQRQVTHLKFQDLMAGTTGLVSMVDVVGHRRSIFIIYFNVFVETKSGLNQGPRSVPRGWSPLTLHARQVETSCTRRINTWFNFFWEKPVISLRFWYTYRNLDKSICNYFTFGSLFLKKKFFYISFLFIVHISLLSIKSMSIFFIIILHLDPPILFFIFIQNYFLQYKVSDNLVVA